MILSVFAVWSNFYVITGSSAAALIGLMFVVVTLIAGNARPTTANGEGSSTFSTPTVVHFCAAFLMSGIMSAPWQSPAHAGAIIGLAGIAGILYVLRVIHKTSHLTVYKPVFEDWIWFGILPLVAYIAIAVTGVLLLVMGPQALFALAGATLLLIFIGIHNAWDIVTYIAIERDQLFKDDTGD
ncbi:MAG: hypothetical protein M3126_06900 [Candidatus Eremiobacteraeota bacterium]|nr:hypothetical protein [Candidatus Eremiobacteraeota bacterium]